MNKIIALGLLIVFSFQSCIKDDILFDTVDPLLRITSVIDSLEINTNFQFESIYLNNIGQKENVMVQWTSSDESIIAVTNAGLASAIAPGSAVLKVQYTANNANLEDQIKVNVGESTTITNDQLSGSIRTTSTYALRGDFTMEQVEANAVIDIAENYVASTALPGLYLYLSNNQNSISGALEIGRVITFSGAHQYIVENIGVNDYRYIVYFCKPFNIKVGDGEIN